MLIRGGTAFQELKGGSPKCHEFISLLTCFLSFQFIDVLHECSLLDSAEPSINTNQSRVFHLCVISCLADATSREIRSLCNRCWLSLIKADSVAFLYVLVCNLQNLIIILSTRTNTWGQFNHLHTLCSCPQIRELCTAKMLSMECLKCVFFDHF